PQVLHHRTRTVYPVAPAKVSLLENEQVQASDPVVIEPRRDDVDAPFLTPGALRPTRTFNTVSPPVNKITLPLKQSAHKCPEILEDLRTAGTMLSFGKAADVRR